MASMVFGGRVFGCGDGVGWAAAVVVDDAVMSALSSSSLVISDSSRPLDLRNLTFFSLLESLTASSCRNLRACFKLLSGEVVLSVWVGAACCHDGTNGACWLSSDSPIVTGLWVYCKEKICWDGSLEELVKKEKAEVIAVGRIQREDPWTSARVSSARTMLICHCS